MKPMHIYFVVEFYKANSHYFRKGFMLLLCLTVVDQEEMK